MTIKWFDDLKMNNAGGDIPPTFQGIMDISGSSGNSTYVGGGLSLAGLDLSYNGTASGVVHASKIGLSADASPYVAFGFSLSEYKFNGGLSALVNPAALPTGNGLGVSFSPDGTYMAVAHVNTPFITIYKRSGDTFTKLANSVILIILALLHSPLVIISKLLAFSIALSLQVTISLLGMILYHIPISNSLLHLDINLMYKFILQQDDVDFGDWIRASSHNKSHKD